MQITRITTALFFAVAACGNDKSPVDAGSDVMTADGAADVDRCTGNTPPTTPADGGGVCCTLTGAGAVVNYCDEWGGGWAASPSDCCGRHTQDVPMHVIIDSHGCEALEPYMSCQCPGPPCDYDASLQDVTSE